MNTTTYSDRTHYYYFGKVNLWKKKKPIFIYIWLKYFSFIKFKVEFIKNIYFLEKNPFFFFFVSNVFAVSPAVAGVVFSGSFLDEVGDEDRGLAGGGVDGLVAPMNDFLIPALPPGIALFSPFGFPLWTLSIRYLRTYLSKSCALPKCSEIRVLIASSLGSV